MKSILFSGMSRQVGTKRQKYDPEALKNAVLTRQQRSMESLKQPFKMQCITKFQYGNS